MENDSGRYAARCLRISALLALASAVAAAGAPSAAQAASAGAHLDWTYGHSETRTSDLVAGTRTESSSDQFVQRYGMNYSASLFPYLLMRLGYVFDRSMSAFETEGVGTRSSRTMTSPAVDLTLANPRFSASAGFRRHEQKQDPGGRSPVSDTYNASFGIKQRERRPSFSLLFSRALLYDEHRRTQDSVTDTTSISSRYSPVKPLDLGYRATLTESEDRITNFESRTLGQTLRASYGEDFLKRRMSFQANSTLAFQQSEYSVPGAGPTEVTLSVAPVQAISGAGPLGTDVFPETPQFDTVVSKPLLIDGNSIQPTDINIGYTPTVTNPRNLGLVFAAPTEMNLIFVVINQDITALAGSYVWDVYTSQDLAPIDTGPKRWTLVLQAAPAVFNSAERRFEISFAPVKAQLMKLVVRPLASPAPVPNVDVSNILVTELQAFNRVSSSDLAGRTTRSSAQTYDLSLRTKLLETPLLHHELFYWHTQSQPAGSSRYFFSNGITASHRFSKIFSGTARTGRSDSDEREGHRTSYQTAASLTATPLSTLSHNLVLSRGSDRIGNAVSSSWSGFLSNYAEPYSGININVGAGQSGSASSSGVVTRTATLNSGLTVVPHRLLSFSTYFSESLTEQHGPGVPETTGRTSSTGSSAAYTPFPSLYLSAARSLTKTRGDERSRTESYSSSWSPFAGGALQVSIGYSQEMVYPADQRTATGSMGASLRINPRLHLSGSYMQTKSESPLALSRSQSFTANLRWLF